MPNLVATKNTGGGLPVADDLLRHAPELMHFMGEGNFPHGAMFGSVGLLATMGELTPSRCRELLRGRAEARRRDAVPRSQHDFERISDDLWAWHGRGAHMDGAYDKMLTKLGMLPDFPLRLLSPYQSFDERLPGDEEVLDERWRDWLDQPGRSAGCRTSGAALRPPPDAAGARSVSERTSGADSGPNPAETAPLRAHRATSREGSSEP